MFISISRNNIKCKNKNHSLKTKCLSCRTTTSVLLSGFLHSRGKYLSYPFSLPQFSFAWSENYTNSARWEETRSKSQQIGLGCKTNSLRWQSLKGSLKKEINVKSISAWKCNYKAWRDSYSILWLNLQKQKNASAPKLQKLPNRGMSKRPFVFRQAPYHFSQHLTLWGTKRLRNPKLKVTGFTLLVVVAKMDRGQIIRPRLTHLSFMSEETEVSSLWCRISLLKETGLKNTGRKTKPETSVGDLTPSLCY